MRLAAMVLPLVAGFLLALWVGGKPEVGLCLGVLAAIPLLAAVRRVASHRNEYTADAWAARRGGALTEEVAHRDFPWPRLRIQVLQSVWGTHPPTFRRVRRGQQALAHGATGDPSACPGRGLA